MLTEGSVLSIYVQTAVDEDAALEDVYISITPGAMQKAWFPALLAALLEPLVPIDAEPRFDMWEHVTTFPAGLGPARKVEPPELAFRFSRGW